MGIGAAGPRLRHTGSLGWGDSRDERRPLTEAGQSAVPELTPAPAPAD
jgi:hypothetical protein